jgi:hypothetical protein
MAAVSKDGRTLVAMLRDARCRALLSMRVEEDARHPVFDDIAVFTGCPLSRA